MLHYVTGDMFQPTYDAIVNTVNCVGVMGKGLALSFKQKYPDNFLAYRQFCFQHKLKPGHLFVYGTSPIIINLATKDHWRNPSQMQYVIDGTNALAAWLRNNPQVKTIAVPKLGCGCGGLNWPEVQMLMNKILENVPQDVYIYV
jgi:O-acetyl-ADP-ribose deacetylase (regulator of RNase III)